MKIHAQRNPLAAFAFVVQSCTSSTLLHSKRKIDSKDCALD